MAGLMVSLEFTLHPVVSAVEVIGHRVVHLAPLHPGGARTDVSALAANAAGRNLSLGDVLKCQSDVRGVSSALKSIQDHQITCVLSQRTPTRGAVELHETQRRGARWACCGVS